MYPHHGKISVFKAPRRGHDACMEMDETPQFSKPPQQVQIFKERKCAKAADGIVGRPPNEDTRVSVAQVQPTKRGIDAGKLPGGARAAIEEESKISAHDGIVFQRVHNIGNGVWWRNGIGMYEPKNVPA